MNYKCSVCHQDLLGLKPANLVVDIPKLDDLLVCGTCGVINIVGLEGTTELTELGFKLLHPDEQSDLRFAQRIIISNKPSN